MKDNIWKWLIILLVGINLIYLVLFWLGRSSHNKSPLPPEKHIERELELSKDQAKIFHDLHRKHLDETKSLHDRIKSIRSELFKQSQQNVDDSLIFDSLYQELANTHIYLEKNIHAHYLELQKLLNKEQMDKLQRMLLQGPKSPPGKPVPPPGRRG